MPRYLAAIIALAFTAAVPTYGQGVDVERMARVEADVAGLKSDVGNISEVQKSILAEVRALSSSKNTDWNALAGWGAVFIAALGGIFHLSLDPIRREVETVAEMRASTARAEDRANLAVLLHLWRVLEEHKAGRR